MIVSNASKLRIEIYLLIFLTVTVLTKITSIESMSNNFIHRCGFQESCDFIFDSTNDLMSAKPGGSTFLPSKVKDGSIIFVRRMALNDFFSKMHPNIKKRYILITHIDDLGAPKADQRSNIPDYDYTRYLKDPKIIAWFGINSNIRYHRKFIPIPIGIHQFIPIIDYDSRAYLNNLFTGLKNNVAKSKWLYMNFTVRNNELERSLVKNIFLNKPFCFNRENQLGFEDYMKEMAQFKFVLSPPGNGIDCYRTWEALLVGCIPIVKSSCLNPLYRDLPVLVINNWEEVTERFLKAKYTELSLKKYNFEKLYMEYWLRRINSVKRRYSPAIKY